MKKILWKTLGAIGLEPITESTEEASAPEQSPKQNRLAAPEKQQDTPNTQNVAAPKTFQPEKKQEKTTYIKPNTRPHAIEISEPGEQPRTRTSLTAKKTERDPTRPTPTKMTEEIRQEMEAFDGEILSSIDCPKSEQIYDMDYIEKNPNQCLITSHGYVFTNESSPWNTETTIWIKRANTARRTIRKIFTTQTNVIRTMYDNYSKKFEDRDLRSKKQKSIINGLDTDSDTKKRAILIINEAFNAGATDIHFDTEEKEGYVWFRINSLLIRHETMPSDEMIKMLTVLYQIMEGNSQSSYQPKKSTDQATLEGEDDRVSHLINKNISRLRCQFRPIGNTGGSLVMRINGKDPGRNLSLQEIGYSHFQRDIIEDATFSPSGLIWITGPTGCGKSMTAKTVLEDIGERFTENQRLAIMAIEDPREYDFRFHILSTSLSGSKSAEEHKKKYAAMISVLLRSNPNINYFGETRTGEVLELVFQSSETGHLTLSTLHVNSSHGIFSREKGMGAPDYNVYNIDMLKAAIAQRLVPKVCPHCAITWEEGKENLPNKTRKNTETLLKNHPGLLKNIRLKKPGGCEKCKPKESGEFGRTAICEVLKPDETYIETHKNKGQGAAVRYWKENLNGISFQEHGLYKMIMGYFDPHSLTLQTGSLCDITTPERIEKIIEVCSGGKLNIERVEAMGVAEKGKYHEID